LLQLQGDFVRPANGALPLDPLGDFRPPTPTTRTPSIVKSWVRLWVKGRHFNSYKITVVMTTVAML